MKLLTNDRASLYPPRFLLETQATIDLLFPVSQHRALQRRRKLSEKNGLDLEVGPLGTDNGEPDRDLDAYNYWGARLVAIEEAYQQSRPGRLKQWYYDRRDKDSLTTFWFAFGAFVLAFVFGLISAITSILQTYKAYHPASPPSLRS